MIERIVKLDKRTVKEITQILEQGTYVVAEVRNESNRGMVRETVKLISGPYDITIERGGR